MPTIYVNRRGKTGVNAAALRKLVAAELALARQRIADGTPRASYYADWVVARGEKSP